MCFRHLTCLASAAAVAAAILAAVEGGILPPGSATLNEALTAKPTRESAEEDAQLYGGRDFRATNLEAPWPQQVPGV